MRSRAEVAALYALTCVVLSLPYLVLRYLGYVGWAELYFALAFIPTGASIVFLLASSLLWDTGSGRELRKTLRSVVAPAIFLYLFLAAASSLMASVLKIPVS